MICIYCDNKTKITNSRPTNKSRSTWRRRQCQACQAIFTTREFVDLEGAIRVKSDSGHLQPFYRDKLFISVVGSLSHRKTAQTDASNLTETIIKRLLLSRTPVLTSAEIAATTTEVLSKFDNAGTTYYKSHHSSGL